MKSLRNFWLKHKIICNFISKTLLDKVETAKNKFLSTSYKERSIGHFDVEEVTKSTSYGALVLEANEWIKMSERLITAQTLWTLTCALVLEIHVSKRSARRVLWNLPVVFTAMKMSSSFSFCWVTCAPSEAGCPPFPLLLLPAIFCASLAADGAFWMEWWSALGDWWWATLVVSLRGLLVRNWKST